MPEFIERSETAEFFEKSKQTMWHKDDIAATISSKSNVPAADVAEVVHSKWIKRNNERRCPVCGFFYLTNGMTVYNFCPMCGAKMAKLTASIQINGINFVTEVIERFMNEAEFKETVSEEYKKGFYDFGNAVINVLEKARNERRSEE